MAEGYWIFECNKCSHRFADIATSAEHPQKVYTDNYFKDGKAGYPDYLLERDMLIERGRYYSSILSRFTQAGEMLDIGTAAGFILKGFTQSGWKGMGLEPNAQMAEYARKELQLPVFTSPVEDFRSEKKFDLVSMIQVLPHFYDLNRGLSQIAALTKPGGYWLIETWNKDSLTAKLLGKYWHEYSPPSVLHWFSPTTIQFFGKQFGMHLVAKGRPSKKISGRHVKSLLHYKMKGIPFRKVVTRCISLIPDHLIFPYPAEDLFWILLRNEEPSCRN